MLGRPHLDYHLVAVSSGVVALGTDIPSGLVSLAVGLLGVVLARWVFVNKQYRETARPPRRNETLPLTLVAMLVASVLIYDRKFGVSTAAFVGLGIGWTAVFILDILGDWILSKMKMMFSAGPASSQFPKVADLSGHDGRLTSKDVDLPGDFLSAVEKLSDVPAPKPPSPPK